MSHVRPGGRRLILLRHAKAEPGGGSADQLRALAMAGRRQCGDIGLQLVTRGLVPELVLVSSAVRTQQTWELIRHAMGDVPEPEVVVTDDLYDAGPRDVLELLREIDERVAGVLVVGHEPTMSVTASMLADPTPPIGDLGQLHTGLSTGGYAVLEVADWGGVDRGSLRLLEVGRPPR
jgi:phosphohistidine phosphatase